jgi:DNA repair protein RadA/Sms
MLLAVLEKRAGFKLSVKDVFLNMAGGLKVSDPACDLAVVSAVLSSNFDFAIPSDVCFAGEIGLSGEVRPVAQTDRRIIEAARLGFKKIYVSSFSSLEGLDAELSKMSGQKGVDIQVVKVSDVPALCRTLFKGN